VDSTLVDQTCTVDLWPQNSFPTFGQKMLARAIVFVKIPQAFEKKSSHFSGVGFLCVYFKCFLRICFALRKIFVSVLSISFASYERRGIIYEPNKRGRQLGVQPGNEVVHAPLLCWNRFGLVLFKK